MKDSQLMSKKISTYIRVLVVGKKYLKSKQLPKTPKGLEEWDWVGIKMRAPYKKMKSPKGQWIRVKCKSQIIVNDLNAASELSIAGCGLSTPLLCTVEKEIKSGTLVELFPKWQVEPIDVYGVWPMNITKKGLTKLFLDHLCENIE